MARSWVERAWSGRRRARYGAHRRAVGTRVRPGVGLAREARRETLYGVTERLAAHNGAFPVRWSPVGRACWNIGRLAERGEEADDVPGLSDHGDELAELSTPMIPITEQVMVMPLIGTMDEQRARHVHESALSGAEARTR